MKKLFTIFGGLLIAFLTVQSAHASFGVSPAVLSYQNIKPGTSYTTQLTISRANPDKRIRVQIEPDMGEVNDWITFSTGDEFTMERGEGSKIVNATIDIPQSSDLNAFKGHIRIYVFDASQEDSGGVTVVKGTRIDVDLASSDEDYIDFIVRNLSFNEVHVNQDITLQISAENRGNVPTAPTKVSLEILDIQQQPLDVTLETDNLESLMPGEKKTILATFENPLEKGSYFANTKVYLQDEVIREEMLYFEVTTGKISPEPVVEETVEIDDKTEISDDIIGLTAIIIISILFIILLLVLRRGDKDEDKKNLRRVLAVLATIIYITSLAAILVTLNYDSVQKLIKKESIEEEIEEIEEIIEDEQRGTSVTVTDAPETADGETLGVVDRKYPIYTFPTTDSIIKLYAEEGTTFEVLEEIDGWYKVKFPDSSDGWISDKDIRSKEFESVN